MKNRDCNEIIIRMFSDRSKFVSERFSIESHCVCSLKVNRPYYTNFGDYICRLIDKMANYTILAAL